MSYFQWAPYVPVAERRRNAAREIAALEKKGIKVSPIVIAGRSITTTFWGKAWCENLERYSDFANRLPRGRTYVRNGSVVDLQIEKGKVSARVQGSSLYRVEISIGAVAAAEWKEIVGACAGQIASVIELLQGKLSRGVMDVITRKDTGLFPPPKQIDLSCTCPDFASMCKHVAAALYGVGARLDREPDLLFRLRSADPTELVAKAAEGAALGRKGPAGDKVLGGDLASMFGIDLDGAVAPPPAPAPATPATPAKPVKAKARSKATGKAVAPAPPKVAARRTASKPATSKVLPSKPAVATTSISAYELGYYGVPQATIQSWLRSGVLLRTSQRGIYHETPASRERLARYQEESTA